jgi:hypothetical protein
LVRFLPGDPQAKAQGLPGKTIMLNGKFILSAADTLSWYTVEVPESGGAAGVVMMYGRIFMHPEYVPGSNTSAYAGILPYAVRTSPGGSWYIECEPYCLGWNFIWDNGAGTTAWQSNAMTCNKAQPLVLRKDDIDGKFYFSVIAGSGAFTAPGEVLYHVRCRVFRYPTDPLIKGAVPTINNQNIGLQPKQGEALDVEGAKIPTGGPPVDAISNFLTGGGTVSQPSVPTTPEREALIRRVFGL